MLASSLVPANGDARSFPFTNVSSITINHGWGVLPNVECIDGDGTTFIPYSVERPDLNTVIVTFTDSKSGNVLLTYGSGVSGGGEAPVGGNGGNAIAYAYFIN